ncbi:MAG TPA: alpha-amylase family protein [Deltaproteobacteria bacterium]|nr:alpha-amylase family protein [Deltaproteobacteria bacterium]HQB37788.1 alpha-amylase family protein [Deltaproteobacteria bacterium]
MRDVILHAFDWRYGDLEKNAARISELGYGAVLTPPPLYTDEYNDAWWQRYQPRDYRVIRSYLGRKMDLVRAIEALHDKGLRVYADVVFNHMANEKNRPDPYNFPGEAVLKRYASLEERQSFQEDLLYGELQEGLFSCLDFNPRGDISNWGEQEEVQEKWLGGLPDLDMNDWVKSQQRQCLLALHHLGFDGFRVDAMKHMPVEHLQSVFELEELNSKFVFGETLTFNDREEYEFLWPLIRETDFPCYDFPLQETLRRVFSPAGSMRELSDPAAYAQALPHERAVTVSITHDIPNNDGFRGILMDPQDEYLSNAYLLGRDGGVPLIYSDNNQSAAKYPHDRNRWAEAWQRQDIAAMIRFHNAVHGAGQRPLYEQDGYLVFARGDRGVVAINKTACWQDVTIWTWGLRHGSYLCQIHGHRMQLAGEYFTFAIPPRQAQMWLFDEC